MKDYREQRALDGELVILAGEDKLIYGVLFKECIFIQKYGELECIDAITSDFIKIQIPTGKEISIRKSILQDISNSDFDNVIASKAAKLCGKKKMEVTPFIQSIVTCIASGASTKRKYRFKSSDAESLSYIRLYSRELTTHIKETIGKDVKIVVDSEEIVITVK